MLAGLFAARLICCSLVTSHPINIDNDMDNGIPNQLKAFAQSILAQRLLFSTLACNKFAMAVLPASSMLDFRC